MAVGAVVAMAAVMVLDAVAVIGGLAAGVMVEVAAVRAVGAEVVPVAAVGASVAAVAVAVAAVAAVVAVDMSSCAAPWLPLPLHCGRCRCRCWCRYRVCLDNRAVVGSAILPAPLIMSIAAPPRARPASA